MIGTFIAVFLGVTGVVYVNYPDRIAYPREFPGGLERELGGPGAVRVRWITNPKDVEKLELTMQNRRARRVMRTLEPYILAYHLSCSLCTCNLGRNSGHQIRVYPTPFTFLSWTCPASCFVTGVPPSLYSICHACHIMTERSTFKGLHRFKLRLNCGSRCSE